MGKRNDPRDRYRFRVLLVKARAEEAAIGRHLLRRLAAPSPPFGLFFIYVYEYAGRRQRPKVGTLPCFDWLLRKLVLLLLLL